MKCEQNEKFVENSFTNGPTDYSITMVNAAIVYKFFDVTNGFI